MLEIGIGNCVNLDFYPPSTRLTGLDANLDTALIKSHAKSWAKTGSNDEKDVQLSVLYEGSAENLRDFFPENSFDVVVSTFVLCSVVSPEAVLREIRRVLKPGGQFICLEHVLAHNENIISDSSASGKAGDISGWRIEEEERPSFHGFDLRSQQLLLNPLQQLVANNCHLDRRTDLLLLESKEFRNVLKFQELNFHAQWPINSQFAAVIAV